MAEGRGVKKYGEEDEYGERTSCLGPILRRVCAFNIPKRETRSQGNKERDEPG